MGFDSDRVVMSRVGTCIVSTTGHALRRRLLPHIFKAMLIQVEECAKEQEVTAGGNSCLLKHQTAATSEQLSVTVKFRTFTSIREITGSKLSFLLPFSVAVPLVFPSIIFFFFLSFMGWRA